MSEIRDASNLIRTDAVAVTGCSEIVWVSGPDTITFLDGLLSQGIAALPEGATGRSLLLAPNGKLRATLFVLRGEDRVGLVCDAGLAEIVAGDLRRFKIRVDAEIVIDDRPVNEVWGLRAAESVPGLAEPGRWTEDDLGPKFRMPFRHVETDRIVMVGSVPAATMVPAMSVAAFRIESGEPIMGIDLTEKTIPQEGVDVAASVDFTKGCYLGQELVARIESRGHVNRRLMGLVIDDDLAPPSGMELLLDGAGVGVVTSAAWSEAMSRVVAIGMVRVEVEPGTEVRVGAAAARVVALPMIS